MLQLQLCTTMSWPSESRITAAISCVILLVYCFTSSTAVPVTRMQTAGLISVPSAAAAVEARAAQLSTALSLATLLDDREWLSSTASPCFLHRQAPAHHRAGEGAAAAAGCILMNALLQKSAVLKWAAGVQSHQTLVHAGQPNMDQLAAAEPGSYPAPRPRPGPHDWHLNLGQPSSTGPSWQVAPAPAASTPPPAVAAAAAKAAAGAGAAAIPAADLQQRMPSAAASLLATLPWAVMSTPHSREGKAVAASRRLLQTLHGARPGPAVQLPGIV